MRNTAPNSETEIVGKSYARHRKASVKSNKMQMNDTPNYPTQNLSDGLIDVVYHIKHRAFLWGAPQPCDAQKGIRNNAENV